MAMFTADHILIMAVKAEEQGKRFYRECAHHATEKEAEALFDYLIAQEETHRRFSAERQAHDPICGLLWFKHSGEGVKQAP